MLFSNIVQITFPLGEDNDLLNMCMWFYYYFFKHGYVQQVHPQRTAHTWRTEDTLQELAFPLQRVAPGTHARAIRLGSKAPHH